MPHTMLFVTMHAQPCTWGNGCCARHPHASSCNRQMPPESSRSRKGQPAAPLGRGSQTAAATLSSSSEAPAEREAGVLALRRAAERRAMLERRFQPAVNDSLYYLSPAADRSVLRSLCAPLAGTEARRWPRSRLHCWRAATHRRAPAASHRRRARLRGPKLHPMAAQGFVWHWECWGVQEA